MNRLTQLRSGAEAEKALLIGKLDAAIAAVMEACGFDPDSDGAFEVRGRLRDQRSAVGRALEAEAALQAILPSSEGADRVAALTRLRNTLDGQPHGVCRTCGRTLL